MDNKRSYTDFLNNDKFVEWQFLHTEELEQYWKEYIVSHPGDEEAINIAIAKYKAVRFNDNKLPEHIENALFERIKEDTLYQRKRNISVKRYLYIAASVIVIVASTLVLRNKLFIDKDTYDLPVTGLYLPEEDITLVSGSNVVSLNKDTDIKLTNSGDVSLENQDGEKETLSLSKNVMNKLIVPYGKRSTLVLSDGSKMWINSGTEVEFPATFQGSDRTINVKGEIYIEVAKDAAKPFYVNTSGFDVRVYGTKFNVSAYNDDNEKSVVLVQGSVGVNTAQSGSFMLTPSEMLSVKQEKAEKKKVNAQEYYSWKDGILVFNQTSIHDILQKLGKYYNISFDISNKSDLLRHTCTGKLVLSDNIDDVLQSLTVFSSITFTRKDDRIYINKK